jgi:hypothetical protein
VRSIPTRPLDNKLLSALPRAQYNLLAPHPAVVQMPTYVSKIASHRFRTIVETSEQLRNLCIEYNEALLSQARVIAACNALHSVEARFCRWLLQSADRANSDTVALTQEFLAEMLGVRRTSVTAVAKTLQDQGVLNYSHGVIHIQDRHKLAQTSCECYRTLLDQSATLQSILSQV